jgi:hypothetical protein
MKRLIPESLINFLNDTANSGVIKADCFAIELPTGQVIFATEGQWDITFKVGTPGWSGPQTTFKAVQFGRWKRGPITSEAGFSLASNTMDLTCIPTTGTVYPGTSVSIPWAVLNQLFDGSTVWVWTAYMPLNGYGDVSNGIETKMQGTMVKVPKLGRNQARFTVADPLYALNVKVPGRIFQSDCGFGFADSQCGLNPDDYTVSFSVSSTDQTTLTPSSLPQPDGYFTQGVVTGLTGQNAGLTQTVRGHGGGSLVLMQPFILPVASGDTFAVIKGCDKTATTCIATTRKDGTPETDSARRRFGGTPFVPPPTSSI